MGIIAFNALNILLMVGIVLGIVAVVVFGIVYTIRFLRGDHQKK